MNQPTNQSTKQRTPYAAHSGNETSAPKPCSCQLALKKMPSSSKLIQDPKNGNSLAATEPYTEKVLILLVCRDSCHLFRVRKSSYSFRLQLSPLPYAEKFLFFSLAMIVITSSAYGKVRILLVCNDHCHLFNI